MYIVQRPLTILRGLLKRFGPARVKMLLWDQEFSSTHWDFIDNTAGDCVYPHIEKHLKGGSILDLGCGPGNTANELAVEAYTTYVGVDISEAALAKARKRTEENGRAAKNTFVCSDFFGFQPTEKFDVILFRESMYHVPVLRVKPLLERFSKYLKDDGVFVVRIYLMNPEGRQSSRIAAIASVMEEKFDVIEKSRDGGTGATVFVFRPRGRAGEAWAGNAESRTEKKVHA